MGCRVEERIVYERLREGVKGNETTKPPSVTVLHTSQIASALHRIEVDKGCSGGGSGKKSGSKDKHVEKMRGMEGVWVGAVGVVAEGLLPACGRKPHKFCGILSTTPLWS